MGQFIGIDVAGLKKGQAVAIMDLDQRVTQIRHGLTVEDISQWVIAESKGNAVIAIDSPRRPTNRIDGRWGRECERQLHKQGLRVQWTPPAEYFENDDTTKEWMRIGFNIFEEFEKLQEQKKIQEAIEVFPSASYSRFPPYDVTIPFHLIDRKAKADQLDAVCCALTAWCYFKGQSEAFGDDEGGKIIVPYFEAD